jgi:hypothetical protein
MGDQLFARPLPKHGTTQTQNKHKTSMPLVCFEPTTPVFERVKAVHALDRAATAIGICEYEGRYKPLALERHTKQTLIS